MASWNNKREGDDLETCPICLSPVSKRRMTLHKSDCWEKYKESSPDLIQCPLYPQHIFPKKFLNHHLEGNCDQAMNHLKAFFQKEGHRARNMKMPPDFLGNIPDNLLNQHNKQLLYLLKRDIDGSDLSKRTDLFPDEL